MPIDIVSSKDVEKKDTRNIKIRYLQTDAICAKCGAVTNSYYDDSCNICSCGGKDFITGKLSVDIRTILEIHIQELKLICELEGVGAGSRPKMAVGLIKKIYPRIIDEKINETLMRKIMIRNKKKFYYMRDIDSIVTKRKKKLKLIPEEDII